MRIEFLINMIRSKTIWNATRASCCIDDMSCQSIIKNIETLSNFEIQTHVLHNDRLCHFNPEELSRLALHVPTGKVKEEILKRRQTPLSRRMTNLSHVWSVTSLHALILAFPTDNEISRFVELKLDEAPDDWFSDADTETLITLLHALSGHPSIMRELVTRRYSLTSLQLESILTSQT